MKKRNPGLRGKALKRYRKTALGRADERLLRLNPRLRHPAPLSRIHTRRRNAGYTVAGGKVDKVTLRELLIFMDNERSIYNQKISILLNLARKMKSGKYSPRLAPKLWEYWVESGAKSYARQFSTPADWSRIFPPALRRFAARAIARYEEYRLKNGEYEGITYLKS